MSAKVCVNYSGTATREKVEALRAQVANALGVLVEDVVILVNATISVVNVPDDLTVKRELAEMEAKQTAVAVQEIAAKEEAADEGSVPWRNPHTR